MGISVDVLRVADSAESWRSAGFEVAQDGSCQVGEVRIVLVGPGDPAGILGWTLSGVPAATKDVDGIATEVAGREDLNLQTPTRHPNGVTTIDHLVLMTPNLDRTVAALADLGADPRRERDGVLGGAPIRQVFYRLGPVILEVVGAPGETGAGLASLWGITYVVDDIDATAAWFSEHTSPVKDAVQPGRRITTLRHRELGLSVRTALISAHPGSK